MKGEMMNVETLSRPDLLTLLSILEGELEAQDVVIHTLRAQCRDSFVQERYGLYDLSDPFLALQRDSQTLDDDWTTDSAHSHTHTHPGRAAGGPHPNPSPSPSPLAVLKLVMAHCRRMQERMMGQLAAAESRHRRVIAELEEERRRHAQDAAQGDDVTFMLEKEREKLLQQLEEERASHSRLEEELRRSAAQADDAVSRQRQLAPQLQRALAKAQDEAGHASQLRRRLAEAEESAAAAAGALEGERGRAEGRVAELEAELERTRAAEEERGGALEREVEELRRRLEGGEGGKEAKLPPLETATASSQTEPVGKLDAAPKAAPPAPKVNGHHHAPVVEADTPQENGSPLPPPPPPPAPQPPSHPPPPPRPSLSPSSTASSSLSSSPVSSPVLAKRPLGPSAFHHHQSPFHPAGANQRFHAARHKFQSQSELEQLGGGASAPPLSPRDLSPTAAAAAPATSPPPPPPATPENSAAKQLARNTVTQVLSRFTSQQAGAKPTPPNSSPFGTDYRSLAAASPPASGGGKSSPGGPLSPGVRSPVVSRSHPPPPLLSPVPAKKPSGSGAVGPCPGSPDPSARPGLFPELAGGCGLSSTGQEGAQEPDLLLSSSS